MATRDLTRRFVELRELRHALGPGERRGGDSLDESGLLEKRGGGAGEVKLSDGGEASLLQDAAGGGQGWGGMARHQLPPAWVDKVDLVEEDIRLLQKKMRELSTLHTKRLMVTFDGDEAEREQGVEQATRELTQLFRRTEGQLKAMMAMGGEAGRPPRLTQAEATVRNNIQRATARKLQALSAGFRSSQKEYLRRLQAQKQGGGDFDFLVEEERAAKHRQGQMDPGFNAQQMAILEDTETHVEERDQEINNIVKSIEELSTIFKELAVLVIDQGTILDRIDFNMEQVVERTQEGVSQLHKAEDHQKSALPLKCIAVLVFLIILMLALLVWKHSD